MADIPNPGNPGLGVDAQGNPVIDPTRNVLDLVKAAMERQDDLRGANANLFQALLEGLKHYIDATVMGRVALTDARFLAITKELEADERRRIEHKTDTQKAVDAAFSAAKDMLAAQTAASDKAISKSEATVTGQINAVMTSIDDLKERVGVIETQQRTKIEGHSETRLNTGMVVGIAGTIIAVVSLIITIVVVMRATP